MKRTDDVVPEPLLLGQVTVTAFSPMSVIGRALLASLFLISGLLKLAFHPAIVAAIDAKGIPGADGVAWLVAFFETGASLLLIANLMTTITAAALAAWCLVTAILYHPFWASSGLEQQMQLASFLKNIALIGAFFLVIANERRRALGARQRV